jgi:hypothetical protein
MLAAEIDFSAARVGLTGAGAGALGETGLARQLNRRLTDN